MTNDAYDIATCCRPEISSSDVEATVGMVENVEDAVIGTESGDLHDVAVEHALLANVVNGIVLFDGDSNSNAEWSVGDVIEQNAQDVDLLINDSDEKSIGVSPWKRYEANKAVQWRFRLLWIVILKK